MRMFLAVRMGLPYFTTSDETARIPSMYYDGTRDQLKSSEVIQENALVLSVLIPSDEVRCGSSMVFPDGRC
jgi:hypothetical protein